MLKTTLMILFLSLLPVTESFKALVIGVTSGDTVIVKLDDNTQLRIRLDGIDCPELKQEYGDSAKMATVELCFNKRIRVEKTGIDSYGRTLAFIYADDICVNKELLRLGLAWHYTDYNSDAELARLEQEARKNKVGLWRQPNPESPWDFRHRK